MRLYRLAVCAAVIISVQELTGCESSTSTNADIVGDACATCTIALQRTVILGVNDSAAAAGPKYPTQLVRLANGNFLVGPTYEAGTASMFDRNGRLVQIVGGFGRGPGEMKDVAGVVAWFGDSAAVIHDRNEISVFGPANEYVRHVTIASASFLSSDIRVSGPSLLSRRTGTGGGPDHEIREIALDGVPQRGFGDTSHFSFGRVYSAFVESGDTIWAINSSSYELDAFRRSTGASAETVVRTLDWFPPDGPSKDWGGRPYVQSMVESMPGIMIVLLVRPRDEFRLPAPVDQSGDAVQADRASETADMQERYVQVLEVLDLRSRKPIARLVVEGKWLGGFVSRDEVFAYEEDEQSGAVRLSIWKMTLSGAL